MPRDAFQNSKKNGVCLILEMVFRAIDDAALFVEAFLEIQADGPQGLAPSAHNNITWPILWHTMPPGFACKGVNAEPRFGKPLRSSFSRPQGQSDNGLTDFVTHGTRA